MRVTIACVGRPRGSVADVIADYEARIGRYFRFESIEVKETPFRGQPVDQLLAAEGESLLARIPGQTELIALHRPGRKWSSESLAKHLGDAAVSGSRGVTFAIGGAYGLAETVLDRAERTVSLSAMTLPHEIARLVLAEQLYRAGTILRGEPYHKGKHT